MKIRNKKKINFIFCFRFDEKRPKIANSFHFNRRIKWKTFDDVGMWNLTENIELYSEKNGKKITKNEKIFKS